MVLNHLVSEPRKKKLITYYLPLNPGWLIRILIMVYEIIPIYLGSFSSPNNNPGPTKTRGPFFIALSWDDEMILLKSWLVNLPPCKVPP